MKSLINLKKEIPLVFSRARNPLFYFQQEINRVFDDFFYSMSETSFPPIDKLIISPSINIVEDDRSFKIEVEMPGMGKDDVDVSISNKILSIRGKKKVSKKNEGKNYVAKEISYGSYEKNIDLPDYIDTDKALATFKKGMLWVTFPKSKDSEKHRKAIEVEEVI